MRLPRRSRPSDLAVAALLILYYFHGHPVLADNPATAPTEHVWRLAGYLNGTSAEVAAKINGETQRLIDKRKELTSRIAELTAQRDATQAAVLDRVHAQTDYKSIEQEAALAKSRLDEARKDENTLAALDAGSQYNLNRQKMAQMEHDALAASGELAATTRNLAENKQELAKVDPALVAAKKWRKTLLEAIRFSFTLPGPIATGSEGILGDVTVQSITDDGGVLVDFQCDTRMGDGTPSKSGDGILDIQVVANDVHVLVEGIDSHGLTPGQHLQLDSVYRVTDERRDHGWDTIYIAKPEDDPANQLFRLIEALKVDE